MPAETRVYFKPNVPQVLALHSVEGELDDYNQVHYHLSDGRTLTVSNETAVKLNLLELEAGQSFGICKDWTGRKEDPVHWRVWATAQTEQQKAAAEATQKPSELEQQLGASISMARREGPRIVKRKPPTPQTDFEFDRRNGTGTYGPAPFRAVAMAKPVKASDRPPTIGYAEALRHITKTVIATLNDEHEQWNDAAKQDLCSTVFISAAKAGYIAFDFSQEPKA